MSGEPAEHCSRHPTDVSNTQPSQMVRLSLVRKVFEAYTDPKSISLRAAPRAG